MSWVKNFFLGLNFSVALTNFSELQKFLRLAKIFEAYTNFGDIRKLLKLVRNFRGLGKLRRLTKISWLG